MNVTISYPLLHPLSSILSNSKDKISLPRYQCFDVMLIYAVKRREGVIPRKVVTLENLGRGVDRAATKRLTQNPPAVTGTAATEAKVRESNVR